MQELSKVTATQSRPVLKFRTVKVAAGLLLLTACVPCEKGAPAANSSLALALSKVLTASLSPPRMSYLPTP